MITSMLELERLPHPGGGGQNRLDLPEVLDRWREEEPVRRIAVEGGGTAWLFTRHADIRAALGDNRLSADRNRPGFPHLRPDDPPMPPGTFNHYDPPEHTVIRRMLAKAFMPKSIDLLKPGIHRIVSDVLDRMADKPRTADLYEEFALPLPSLVLCELLGVPYTDRAIFQENTPKALDNALPGPEVAAAFMEMFNWLGDFLDAKERHPQDDLMSDVAVNYVRTGVLPKEEAVGAVLMLLLAGHDATATMIGLGAVGLLRHAEQLRRLVADPAVVPAAVEELLRHLPVQYTGLRRIAVEDVEVGGVTVREGEGVILAVTAGNRDPRVFDDPGMLDVARGSRHHLTFGHGIHQCIGQGLARAQLQIALPAVFERFPGLRLAVPDEEISYRENHEFLSVRHIPVAW
ncbi:cytochrome P450 [Streptomyces phaeolivaceus]|uniref:Cytochrome P450 n=1 Tax=Streptomyces phaeolivaceus TaxID=2653200 RepID=A0A5P8KBS5_9ACTN|nr:cytochrome P450 [Streptomyces phaeolivaceus]QFR00471.1 cytochrome P450 [Streptomyces phaeolivaceus]